ncbi:carbon-nitrogen hydrolase [Imleria badia]|nr:carbon-nitrogen hydrolase [Imleria badia]
MASCSWLRIAVVQFAPKLGEVHANIAKARELCRGLTPRSVDLVCFPEMIFTGYMFPDAPSIAPYLEHPKTGPTASFCSELARRLECFVVAGFPEGLASELAPNSDTSAHQLVGANAASVYDTTGHLVHTYHKSNLFPTDCTWARPGHGFTALDLPIPHPLPLSSRGLRTAVAICNDLNVTAGETWESIEGGPYELAGFCEREGVRVVVLLNAWLRSEDGGMEGEADRGEEDDGGDGLEPNWEVLNYWAMRLRPLWTASESKDADKKTKTDAEEDTRTQQDVIVVVCNRFGRERGKNFAGSSAIFAMRSGSGKPRLLHVMGEREEGIRVWTVRVGSQTVSSSLSS